jgi:NitT/TauT family transport system ATP-binding protein
MSTVTVSDVSKTYPGHGAKDAPVQALDSVSFRVEDHEFCSVLGHSGCGKTTLLMMMAGFEQPTAGRILVDDKPVGKPTWQRSVVFQEYALFPWMTVKENIAFGLEMKNIPAPQREEIIHRNIQLVGLQGFEHRYPQQLSGGMKQRVSIARALAVDPAVLLLDEPFAALDAQNRALMQEEMGRIIASSDPGQRKTMILVTHSIDEAIILSDRIVVLTRRPGHVKADVMVDLPRPRNEDDEGFIALKHQIRELIHDEFAVET